MIKNVFRILAVGMFFLSYCACGASLVDAQISNDEQQKLSIESRNTKQSTETLGLARKYMSSRGDVFGTQNIITPPINKGQTSAVAVSILSSFKNAPDWNKDNPEWQRIANIIERDLSNLHDEFAADTHLREISKQIEGVFIHGLAAHLSVDQLRALIKYYSTPQGHKFSDVQANMTKQVEAGVASAQQLVAAGKQILPMQPTPDEKEFQQILGFFQEKMSIQWAALDPGPGADRSGLQAIPMIVGMGLRLNYSNVNALWGAIPEHDRTDIVSWRQTTLAKAEREAIFESAKEIRTVVNIPEEMQREMKILAQYEQKWRSELK